MPSVFAKFLLAVCIVSASARPGAIIAQESQKASRMKLQPGAEATKAQARWVAPRADSTTASEGSDAPDRQTYGTLLATLVLMAAIAIRRNRSGRP
ncbi:MAG: hypothetical protein JWQ72_1294 [Polaromonas sp.]|nr:hypothetical protein [Polaromonas sp.]